MNSSNNENVPQWITRPTDLRNVSLHSYADTSTLENLVTVADISPIKTAMKQYHYWCQELLSQVSEKTVIFCLLGKSGMTRPNILEVCTQLDSVCNLGNMLETFSAANNNFIGISFSNTEEVLKIRSSFNYFNDCMVLHILPESLDTINFKIQWLPPLFEARMIRGLLNKYSSSFSFENEMTKTGPNQFTRTNVVRGKLKIKDGLSIDNIPHFIHLPSPHKGFALFVIQTRPSLCLRCRSTGHIRSQCTAIKCDGCHSFHQKEVNCSTALYASKLKGYDKNDQSHEWWEGTTEVTTSPVPANPPTSHSTIQLSTPEDISHSIKPTSHLKVPLANVLHSEIIDFQHPPNFHSLIQSSDHYSSNAPSIVSKDNMIISKITDHSLPLLSPLNSQASAGITSTITTMEIDHEIKGLQSTNSDSDVPTCRKKKKLKQGTDITTSNNSSFTNLPEITSSSHTHKENVSPEDPYMLSSDPESIDGSAINLQDETLSKELGCTTADIHNLRSLCPKEEITSTTKKKILLLQGNGFTIKQISEKSGVLRISHSTINKRIKILNKQYATSFSINDICKSSTYFESLEYGLPSK